jgi:arsenical pump membrane protein
VLATAVIRPRRLPEAAIAVPAALLLVAAGALKAGVARSEAEKLLPVVGFLAAVLVLGRLCEDEGLFAWAGARLAVASGGRASRLLAGVFWLSSVTTAVLSLDTTVVLLTPVVFETAARQRVAPKPHMYACTHLANSASLLLPVSNLTNLLAFATAGVSLLRFGELMALPWLAAIAVEYLVFRRFFAADLAVPGEPDPGPGPGDVPLFPLATVAATLAGFVVTSFAGVSPAWAALGGAVALAGRGLASGKVTPGGLVRAAAAPFLLFVLGLGLVVTAVVSNGLGGAVTGLLPEGSSLAALLAVAGIAAVLANVVNNLPAVLVLLPAVAGGAPGRVLAVLIGVNIGPNLPMPARWPRCCGGACSASAARKWTWASSPGSACSRSRPGWRPPRSRCGRRCGCSGGSSASRPAGVPGGQDEDHLLLPPVRRLRPDRLAVAGAAESGPLVEAAGPVVAVGDPQAERWRALGAGVPGHRVDEPAGQAGAAGLRADPHGDHVPAAVVLAEAADDAGWPAVRVAVRPGQEERRPGDPVPPALLVIAGLGVRRAGERGGLLGQGGEPDVPQDFPLVGPEAADLVVHGGRLSRRAAAVQRDLPRAQATDV